MNCNSHEPKSLIIIIRPNTKLQGDIFENYIKVKYYNTENTGCILLEMPSMAGHQRFLHMPEKVLFGANE